MKVKFLLTPSIRIQGLPKPTPQQGETADVADTLGLELIRRNIAVPAAGGKRKVKAVPPKPAISKAEAPDKNEDKE